MYELYQLPHLDAIFARLAKKDKAQFEILQRKVKEILENPKTGKPLRAPLQGRWRVHIGKSFVLTYTIDEASKQVTLIDYDHHGNIYVS